MTVTAATGGVHHSGDNLWRMGPHQLMTTPRSTDAPGPLGQTVGNGGQPAVVDLPADLRR